MATKIDEDDGYQIWHYRVPSPAKLLGISSRSTILCFYHILDAADGSLFMLNSSQGNEEFIEKYKDRIGDDVIAEQVVASSKLVPFDGGCELTQVIAMNTKGSIPDFVKGLLAKRSAKHSKFVVDYLVNGTIPEPLSLDEKEEKKQK